MTVFIVLEGERYEGYEISRVCSSRELASSHAKNIMEFERGGWTQETENYWSKNNHCDYVTIQQYLVDEGN
jgi:hypothetical protein